MANLEEFPESTIYWLQFNEWQKWNLVMSVRAEDAQKQSVSWCMAGESVKIGKTLSGFATTDRDLHT